LENLEEVKGDWKRPKGKDGERTREDSARHVEGHFRRQNLDESKRIGDKKMDVDLELIRGGD
jgi:hypothetical protein